MDCTGKQEQVGVAMIPEWLEMLLLLTAITLAWCLLVVYGN